jgi:hypothetical protein
MLVLRKCQLLPFFSLAFALFAIARLTKTLMIATMRCKVEKKVRIATMHAQRKIKAVPFAELA